MALDSVKEAMGRFADLGEAPSWSHVAEADAAFHQAVVEAGGSDRLRSYFEGISNEIRLLLTLPETHFGRGESPYEEHEELYLVLQGDATLKQLERTWSYHLDESRDFLVGLLSSK